jgi:hypothetical protein
MEALKTALQKAETALAEADAAAKSAALRAASSSPAPQPGPSRQVQTPIEPIQTSIKVTRKHPNIQFDKDPIRDTPTFPKERMEEYYIAVNQLLSETRAQEEPNTSVLIAMKNLVLVCKSLTESVEEFEADTNLDVAESQILAKLKQQLSQALTNQMLIAKKAAVDPTDEVKQKVEDVLLTLTTVVLELFRVAGDIAHPQAPPPGTAPSNGSYSDRAKSPSLQSERQENAVQAYDIQTLDQLKVFFPSSDYRIFWKDKQNSLSDRFKRLLNYFVVNLIHLTYSLTLSTVCRQSSKVSFYLPRNRYSYLELMELLF